MIGIYSVTTKSHRLNVWLENDEISANLLDGTKFYLSRFGFVNCHYSSTDEYVFAKNLFGKNKNFIFTNSEEYSFFNSSLDLGSQFLISPQSMFESDVGFIVGVTREESAGKLVSYSYHNKKDIHYLDPFITVEHVRQSYVYGRHARKLFKKFDSKLNELWSFQLPYKVRDYSAKTKPHLIGNVLVWFVGPTGAHETYNEGGLLVGLDDNTGELIWQKEFVNALDTTCIDEGILYVGTFEGVYLLNPKTGETLNFISSGHSEQIKTCRGRGYAEIVGNFIYYTHDKQITKTPTLI